MITGDPTYLSVGIAPWSRQGISIYLSFLSVIGGSSLSLRKRGKGVGSGVEKKTCHILICYILFL